MGEGSIFFVACFLHSSAQMWLYQMPGRRLPRITGRFVNTVIKEWVGARNERVPFRFHGTVVGSVDRCLSRSRNFTASNWRLAEFFSDRSWPNICSGISVIITIIILKCGPFFLKFDLIASGIEILQRVSLKFKLFLATSRFHCHRSYTGT